MNITNRLELQKKTIKKYFKDGKEHPFPWIPKKISNYQLNIDPIETRPWMLDPTIEINLFNNNATLSIISLDDDIFYPRVIVDLWKEHNIFFNEITHEVFIVNKESMTYFKTIEDDGFIFFDSSNEDKNDLSTDKLNEFNQFINEYEQNLIKLEKLGLK